MVHTANSFNMNPEQNMPSPGKKKNYIYSLSQYILPQCFKQQFSALGTESLNVTSFSQKDPTIHNEGSESVSGSRRGYQ